MGFIWDILIIFLFIFSMFIALPPLMNLGQVVALHTVQSNNFNASENQTIENTSTNFFLNTPSIILALLYFVLILASLITATYQGANAATTLFLGLFFLAIAMLVSFPLSDIAHNYISQAIFINDAQHLSIMVYIMNYAPFFNGVLIIIYMVLVIMRRTVSAPGGGGGGLGLTETT